MRFPSPFASAISACARPRSTPARTRSSATSSLNPRWVYELRLQRRATASGRFLPALPREELRLRGAQEDRRRRRLERGRLEAVCRDRPHRAAARRRPRWLRRRRRRPAGCHGSVRRGAGARAVRAAGARGAGDRARCERFRAARRGGGGPRQAGVRARREGRALCARRSADARQAEPSERREERGHWRADRRALRGERARRRWHRALSGRSLGDRSEGAAHARRAPRRRRAAARGAGEEALRRRRAPRGDGGLRQRAAVRRSGGRAAIRLRHDARVPEDAQAVRRADRHLPGAAAPHRRHVHLARAGALDGVPGGEQGGFRGRPARARTRHLRGEDPRRRRGAPRQPGSGAAARRRGHERRAEDQPHVPPPDRTGARIRGRRPPSCALRRAMTNQRIVLASRAVGAVSEENFRMEDTPVPKPAEGEVLVRSLWLSLDPYMRGRMSDAKSYVKGVEIGEVMVGQTVGEVLESRHPKLAVGDTVLTQLGWQLYGCTRDASRIDSSRAPLSYYLGLLGMPGMTAYFGLRELGQPKAGETVVVSAASGAVGSVVGQLARLWGARAVGIAGGGEKCRYVKDELGFDACIDYKAGRLRDDLKETCPKGVDVYFDNVGGEILDLALARMNLFGRVVVCGTISDYNAVDPYRVRNWRAILVNRLRVQGMIVFDWKDRYGEALKALGGYFGEGRLKYKESIVHGLANAPRGLIDLLSGKNFGKQLVKLG